MSDTLKRWCKRLGIEKLKSLVNKPKRDKLRFDGETGAAYMHRLVHTHPRLCREQLRLTANMVKNLVNLLVSRQLLSDGTHISVLEQVGMTLYILGKGASYRDVADTFKHAPSTVGDYFHKVIDALMAGSDNIIRPHTSLDAVPAKIANSALYFPYFKNCVGALDGTHIQAVLGDNHDQYRGRKGVKTWNVLACCSFDMLFTFVNAGWEGSVHDITVLKDSINQANHCFPHPPTGKYYLVDSGYPNTLGYLAPYKDKSARYHIPDFRTQPPSGIYENFNYRHSSLRTTIERAFGILKSRWKILGSMSQVDGECQTHIILATFTLHNFYIMHKKRIRVQSHNEVQGVADSDILDADRKARMNRVRDMIASDIMARVNEIEVEDIMDENEVEDSMDES
ncbi:hypothetical protein QQ045_002667 [Rhodiola kirilowii]